MAANEMNERLCAQLVGLETDVIANFPPSDRERLIDWPLCRRLNEMIASAQEVEFGLPEQIEENDQYTVAGFLVAISQARRALGCPADEGLQLVEEGLYDDY
jgi:hypothetical protein